MGKGSPAQPHFPRIFAFYDTSSAGSLQGGKNECRFAEVSVYLYPLTVELPMAVSEIQQAFLSYIPFQLTYWGKYILVSGYELL